MLSVGYSALGKDGNSVGYPGDIPGIQ